MRVGDAESEVWLQGRHDDYCVIVRSKLKGRGPVDTRAHEYRWWVERWIHGGLGNIRGGVVAHGKASTYYTAARQALRAADHQEGKAAARRTRKKKFVIWLHNNTDHRDDEWVYVWAKTAAEAGKMDVKFDKTRFHRGLVQTAAEFRRGGTL